MNLIIGATGMVGGEIVQHPELVAKREDGGRLGGGMLIEILQDLVVGVSKVHEVGVQQVEDDHVE